MTGPNPPIGSAGITNTVGAATIARVKRRVPIPRRAAYPNGRNSATVTPNEIPLGTDQSSETGAAIEMAAATTTGGPTVAATRRRNVNASGRCRATTPNATNWRPRVHETALSPPLNIPRATRPDIHATPSPATMLASVRQESTVASYRRVYRWTARTPNSIRSVGTKALYNKSERRYGAESAAILTCAAARDETPLSGPKARYVSRSIDW